jgi:hypothetical protein
MKVIKKIPLIFPLMTPFIASYCQNPNHAEWLKIALESSADNRTIEKKYDTA